MILGLIRRSFSFIDNEIFNLLYKSRFRPILEYGNTIWYPILKKDADAIENVQRRATKLIPGLQKMEYSSRLRTLKLPSLKYRRKRGDMIETYKFLNDIYNTEHSWLKLDDSSTRGHSLKLTKIRCNTELRKHTFSNRIVNDWNSLTEHVISAPSTNSFKSRLDKHWENIMYDID